MNGSQRVEVGGEILAIFIAILFFQSIPRLPQVGYFFDKYPYIIFGIAVILLIYRKKILGVLKK